MAKNVYNALRSVAEGQANRVFKSAVGVLKNKAIDIIRGEKSSGDTSDFAAAFSKYSTQNLTFPLDIEAPAGANGNQGHYIQFFINEQTDEVLDYMNKDKYDAALSKKGFLDDDETILQGMAETEFNKQVTVRRPKLRTLWEKYPFEGLTAKEQRELEPGPNDYESVTYEPDDAVTNAANFYSAIAEIAADTTGVAATKKMNREHQSLSVKRKATVRMSTSICMYMPPTVEVKYGAEYIDTEIGTGTMIGAAAYQDIVAGASIQDVVSDNIKPVAANLSDAALRGAFGAIDLFPGFAGSREVFEMQRGFIKAPRMELAFKGIPKRDFSYEFKMMPKSAAEAAMAEKIVKKFKTMMLPEIKNAGAMQLTMPATFDIQYMHVGQENSHLNKIGTCVLTNMDVKYGGDKYKTYKDAVPMETSMTLNFKELDLITRDKAEEGF